MSQKSPKAVRGKPKVPYIGECYEIKYNYQADGHWTFGLLSLIEVHIKVGDPEKVSHNLAKGIFLRMVPFAEITDVRYL